jgi:hypothetical protein
VYAAAAVWLAGPPTLAGHIIGHPHGDSGEYLNLIRWFGHALATGANPFFHAEIVFPYGAGASLLWSLPLQSFPAWALAAFMPLPAAFNLSLLGFLALNGLAMAWLVSLLTGNRAAALVGGLVYLAYPAFQGQVGAAHIGLVAAFGAPLIGVALVYAERAHTRRGRWACRGLAGAAFTVSGWGGFVLFLYLTAPMMAFLLVRAAWASPNAARRARLVHWAAAAGFGLLGAAVFLVPFLRDRGGVPLADVGGVVAYSAPLLAVVSPSFQHPLYRALPWPGDVLGRDPFEMAGYIGVVTAVLAVCALLGREQRRPVVVAFGVCALCWVLSLGPMLKIADAPLLLMFDGYPTPLTLPYAALAELPGFSLTRTPARFHFGMGAMAALLAGYGFAALAVRFGPHARPARRPTRWAAAFGVCALVLFDTRLFWPMPSIDAALPAAFADLRAGQPAGAPAVFNVPWAHPLTENRAMYAATAHGLPLLGGHIARRTPLDPALADVLETTLSPALLHAAGVGTVIVHRQYGGPALDARARAALGEPAYEDAEWGVYPIPAERPPLPALVFTTLDGRPLPVPLGQAAAVSVYTAEAGTFVVRARVAGPLTVTFDGVPVAEVHGLADIPGLDDAGTRVLEWPIGMAAGFHRIVFAPALACPRFDTRPPLSALACAPFAVDDVTVSPAPGRP